MATEETILINIEVDNQSAQNNLEETTRRIEILKKERAELTKTIKKSNTVTKEQAQALTQVNQALKREQEEQKKYNKAVNTTSNSLNAMRRRLEANKKALGKMDQSTVKGRKQFIALSRETDKLNKKILEQEKGYGVATRQVGQYERAQGALSAASPQAAGALQTVGTALRFLLSPIGLIIGGIALLLKAFTSTRSGGQELAATMEGFSTVLQKIFDIIAPLGKAIFDSLLTPIKAGIDLFQAFTKLVNGDFSGALDELGEIVDDQKKLFNTWSDAIEETGENLKELDEDGKGLTDIFNKAKAISLEFEKLNDNLRDNTTNLERERAELENLRVASRNVALNEEERLELSEKLAKQERVVANLFDEQIRLSKDKLDAQVRLNDLADSGTADLEKEAQLQRDVNRLIAQKERKITEAENAQARLTKQAEAEAKKRADAERKEAEKLEADIQELRQRDLEASIELALRKKEVAAQSAEDLIAIEQDRLNQELLNTELTQSEKEILTFESEQRINDIKENARQEDRAREQAVQQQKLAITSGFLGAVAGLFEQNSNEYKILASAQALVDTYAAANAALKTGNQINPIFGAISAATAVATGLANVAKINNVQFEDGGMIQGKRHSEGGVPFTVRGQAGFEAEGGEYIMSRNTVDRVGVDTLNAMNFGNYVPSVGTFFADGGQVPLPSGVNQVDQGVQQTQAVAQNIMRNFPEIVVGVREFADVQNTVAVKEQTGLS